MASFSVLASHTRERHDQQIISELQAKESQSQGGPLALASAILPLGDQAVRESEHQQGRGKRGAPTPEGCHKEAA